MKIKINNNVPLSHIDNRQAFQVLNQKGIIGIGTPGDDKPNKIYNAAPMITTPNINANLGVLNYIDPECVEVLVAEQTADLIAKPKKVGFWGQNSYTFNIKEHFGIVSPDDGSANNTKKSSTNVSSVIRGCKIFAGYWGSNDIIKSQYSQMQIDIQSEDVKSLMNGLSINRNNIFFTGVKETWNNNQIMPIYGFLNDPNMPAYNLVINNSAGTSTQWAKKTPNEIYNDICVYAFQDLKKKAKRFTTFKSGKFKLVVSNSASVYLNAVQTIGESWISARTLVERAIPGIEIIESPELDSANNGSDVFYLIYEDSKFGDTVSNPYVEMARAYPIFTQHSEISQKISQCIMGCVTRIPMFISRWTGINDNTETPITSINSYSH